jgi:hypothetical protein
MIEWNLNINYNGRNYTLKATVEYLSNQIIRIRVQGSKTALLLENNYPFTKLSTKKGIVWKIREGMMNKAYSNTARLLADIFEELEKKMKTEL